ncbi:uncharacterized protein [Periplaneta americana]|uniref:uncharacterized protein n=1 Tax=Periplaneta americana TaxID=6978 RepID=UPI0037E83CC5
MAKVSNFRPAGFSSDEEGSDEDGFSFAEPIKYQKPKVELNRSAPMIDVPVSNVDLLRIEVTKGNLEAVKSLIEEKEVPVDIITHGWTPLMFAASYCQYDVMDYLLKKGANPNFQHNFYTSLMSACASTKQNQETQLKCVQLLLDSGAAVNIKQRNGVTPLMIACKEGNDRIVEELVKRNADINAQDVMGWTPLIWSIHHSKHGHMDTILFLLKAGADVTIKCGKGLSAHSHAMNLGYHHIASQIPDPASDRSSASVFDQPPSMLDSWQYLKENLCGIDGQKWMLWHDVARSLDQLGVYRRYNRCFKDNSINFVKFLTFTDEELEALSVLPVHRKRILDMTRKLHLKRWKERSLDIRSVKNMHKNYNIIDEVRLLANFARHMTMVHASIIYVRTHLADDYNRDTDFKMGDFCTKVDVALTRVKAFQNSLQSYMRYITTNLGDQKYPPDWIVCDSKETKPSRVLKGIITFGFVSVVGFVIWKTDLCPRLHLNILKVVTRKSV